MQLSEAERTDASNLGALPIQTPQGMVRLDALARVEFVEGPSKIYRADRMRSITVGANIRTGVALRKDESVSKAVTRMSLPAIIGLLVLAIHNVVDPMFVAWLGTEETGATQVAFPIMRLISAFSRGGGSYISQ